MASSRIHLVLGDLVVQQLQAIVNAANNSLLGGGGVDGAIHRAAGPELLVECRGLGGCETGQAKATDGYRLAARHIFHTVGPIYRGGCSGEPEMLRSAYLCCLQLAEDYGCKTVGFPSISTGAYGYPIREAAKIALETARDWLSESAFPRSVTFVLFSQADFQVYETTLSQMED